ISGYAEGLRDNIPDSKEARDMYTEVIIEEAGHMDKIIRQMLDLMELDGTDELLNGREVSLSMLAEAAVESFELILKNNNIKLECSFDEDCTVWGDYMRLQQAVTNYVSNAINHVDENGIISINVKKTGDKVLFSVYNSGAAIPDGEERNIWERFYKVDKAHTREYGGSGLGLSIVRSVIELHNGEYGFKNHNDGVEFYFVLNYKETNNAN
ncbi:MAG: HAMP domain-containing histidine kinase, partial [Clostridia bacterium]|nr:HAMP domain-containing histidine kinase [Clostridia bacterium]